MKSSHIPVLSKELINALNIKLKGIYVDCTLGRGGHSSIILGNIKDGKLIAFDQDQEAIDYCKEKFKNDSNIEIVKSNFKDIGKYISVPVDGIIMDIGVSSPQLDDDSRGFSYQHDGNLDMRMDQLQKLSAKDVVNKYDKEELIKIFRIYGEEKYAVSIAKGIVKAREEKEINTTFELVDIIKSHTPSKYKKLKHPAKKTFQAIRIEVNNELGVLKEGIASAVKLLKPGGILSVITFHSLEDRIIKKYFIDLTTATKIHKDIPVMDVDDTNFILVNKKPIIPSEDEVKKNKRAKSSKLRSIQKRG